MKFVPFAKILSVFFSSSPDIRRTLRAVIDVCIAAASYLLAMNLRLGAAAFENLPQLFTQVVSFAGVCAATFSLQGSSLLSWRFTSPQTIFPMVRSIIVAVAAFEVLWFLVARLDSVPRSVPIIACFILICLMAGCRLLYSVISETGLPDGRNPSAVNPEASALLVYGATIESDALLRSLQSSAGGVYVVVGIIDDDPAARDRRIRGVNVLGTTRDIAKVIKTLARQGEVPGRLVVPDRGLTAQQLTGIVTAAAVSGLRVVRLPNTPALLQQADRSFDFEPIRVEELLGREPHRLALGSIAALVRSKSIIVTGGGGSIGAELCRKLLEREPAKLVVIDNSEFNLFKIGRELGPLASAGVLQLTLASVRDKDTIRAIFQTHKPDLVFHAAAYKHVPLVELNPAEGILTNLIGTTHVADAAAEVGAAAMIMVSTDKAVKPSSVMGLSKRFAEMYCQSLDFGAQADVKQTRFLVVRFGNVLGSSGSVVPLFEQQIREGGPVTITHPEMTRYFMTIREAVELVLQASAYGCGNIRSRGAILVLDMGSPVSIFDLACRMIALAGFRPDIDIAIRSIGIRDGEKLHEELFDDNEKQEQTDMPGVRLARSRVRNPEYMANMKMNILKLFETGQSRAVVAMLHTLLAAEE